MQPAHTAVQWKRTRRTDHHRYRCCNSFFFAMSSPRVPLAAPDLASGDALGCSVAVLGDWALVGACAATSGSEQVAGVVHAVRVASLQPSGVVTPPAPAANARFGSAIAMTTLSSTNGLALIGAPGEQRGRGVVFIFQFPFVPSSSDAFEFKYVQQLVATDGVFGGDTNFGCAIAIHADRVVVGARGPPRTRAPSHMYTHPLLVWMRASDGLLVCTHVRRLRGGRDGHRDGRCCVCCMHLPAPCPLQHPRCALKHTDWATHSLSLVHALVLPSSIIVHALTSRCCAPSRTDSYVFNLHTGAQLAKLQPSNPISGAPLLGCFWFGAAVAISEGVVLVGAPRARLPCATGVSAGAAFAFHSPPHTPGASTTTSPPYNQTAYLLPEEAGKESDGKETRGEFGAAVAIAQSW